MTIVRFSLPLSKRMLLARSNLSRWLRFQTDPESIVTIEFGNGVDPKIFVNGQFFTLPGDFNTPAGLAELLAGL